MAILNDLYSTIVTEASNSGESVTKADAEKMTKLVLGAIGTLIFENRKESLRTPLGTFYLKQTKARKARNPRTGESVDVAARESVGFRASSRWTKVEGQELVTDESRKAKASPVRRAPKAK